MSTWVILGCGFIGTRLARSLLADNEPVLVCGRNKEHLVALEGEGASAYVFDATRTRAFTHAMTSLRAPVVVYCLPPIPGFPGGEIVSRATAGALAAGANRFIYLSSTSVYGEGRDGEVVDEDSPTAISDNDARPYLSAEGAVDNARNNGLDGLIFRLTPVYGKGRGVRERLLAGTYKLLDGGEHIYSRIHVDDVVGIIRTAAERAPINATYCLADDHPCPQKEYADWLADHLGVKKPTSVPSLAPGMPRRRIRNRAVSNARIKSELDYAFRYPTYREGELAIDAELGVQGKDVAMPPLVVHRRADLGKIAEASELHRLQLGHRSLAAGSKDRISASGESVVQVLQGEIQVVQGEESHTLGAGDLVEVPSFGLEVEATDKNQDPAQLLIITAR